MTEEKKKAFIREYERLCYRHGMIVNSCGACSASPAVQFTVWVEAHIKKLRENSRGR